MRAAVIVLLFLATACSGRSKNNDDSSAGKSGDAGEGSGGTTSGGSGGSSGSTSGASSGGSSTGGAGGTSTGGTSTGGTSTGGTATGGTSTGGQAGEAGMGAGGTGMSGAAGASGCEEPAPGGCPMRRCPENQTCQLASGRCIPSQCNCVNGEWACTRDCGGGQCVETSSCTTPDPSGCERNEDCASGQVCTQPAIAVCIPVGCACAPLGGEWQCREECGGGVCAQAMCPMGCEPQPSGFCGEERVTWVCSAPGPIPVQEFLDGGCTDPGTQVPRYCCPPTFKPECQ